MPNSTRAPVGPWFAIPLLTKSLYPVVEAEWNPYGAGAHKRPATGGFSVLDVVYLVCGLVFFALMAAYAIACDRL
jgi:hypothetical protein